MNCVERERAQSCDMQICWNRAVIGKPYESAEQPVARRSLHMLIIRGSWAEGGPCRTRNGRLIAWRKVKISPLIRALQIAWGRLDRFDRTAPLTGPCCLLPNVVDSENSDWLDVCWSSSETLLLWSIVDRPENDSARRGSSSSGNRIFTLNYKHFIPVNCRLLNASSIISIST